MPRVSGLSMLKMRAQEFWARRKWWAVIGSVVVAGLVALVAASQWEPTRTPTVAQKQPVAVSGLAEEIKQGLAPLVQDIRQALTDINRKVESVDVKIDWVQTRVKALEEKPAPILGVDAKGLADELKNLRLDVERLKNTSTSNLKENDVKKIFTTMVAALGVTAAYALPAPATTAIARTSQNSWEQCDANCRREIAAAICSEPTRFGDSSKVTDLQIEVIVDRTTLVERVKEECPSRAARKDDDDDAVAARDDVPTQTTIAWSSQDDRQLNGLLARKAIKLFGPAPSNNHSFRGVRRTFIKQPRNCRERRVHISGGTMVRVVCGSLGGP